MICFLAVVVVLPDVIFHILTVALYVMLFLIFWFTALYFSVPSAVTCLPFFSALRSLQRFNMSIVIHGYLTALRLPRISAVSVIAIVKVLISVSTSVLSASSKVSSANLPPIIPWTASTT